MSSSTSPPSSSRVPKWLPISLLAFSTVALTVPIVLLRRHRASALKNALQNSAPPRKAGGAQSVKFAPNTVTLPSAQTTAEALPHKPASQNEEPEDDFNGGLYVAKAFSIATALVGVGAFASVWIVQRTLGVENTEQFAHRMRIAVMTRMPSLSARIHRQPDDEGDDPIMALQNAEPLNWSWPESERRLREAFDNEGFAGWARAAVIEVQAEAQVERARRDKELRETLREK